MRLKGNRITLGVTGGISVYKICELVRLLKKNNFSVQVVMTQDATKFVTPETFRVLSQREVLIDTFEYTSPERVEHVTIPQETDILVIAPATANTIAKMVHGIADNMLTCLWLAHKGPSLLVPAMNHNMFTHPATQRNISVLKEFGVHVMEPDEGALACGTEGKGRLPAPESIYEEIVHLLSTKDFKGKKVLVTAGPTREHLDPIRFISNPSSGKMGYAIAKAASRRGAQVFLISGPTNLPDPPHTKTIHVTSAAEMYEEVMKIAKDMDVFIMSAAVADYRPKTYQPSKIKKETTTLTHIELERTPDIIHSVAQKKRKEQFIVGFAAETDNVVKNAVDKMKKKNMDMIVANTATQAFQKDTNQVIIIHRSGETRYLPEMPKEDLADEILDELIQKVRQISPSHTS